MRVAETASQIESAANPGIQVTSREAVDVSEASTITGLSVSLLNKARIYRGRWAAILSFGRRCLYPLGTLRAWMLERTGSSSNDERQP